MDIYKFSLPEGTDLKLRIYGAEAHLMVTYEGNELFTGGVFILGEEAFVRKSVFGTSLVVRSPDPLNTYNWANSISRGILEYNEQKVRRAERARRDEAMKESLKHLVGMRMDSSTLAMAQAEAQRSYDETARRLREAELRQNRWHEASLRSPELRGSDFVVREDPMIRPDQMVVVDTNASVGVFTSGVVDTVGGRYVINNGIGYRVTDGLQVEVVTGTNTVTINSLGE